MAVPLAEPPPLPRMLSPCTCPPADTQRAVGPTSRVTISMRGVHRLLCLGPLGSTCWAHSNVDCNQGHDCRSLPSDPLCCRTCFPAISEPKPLRGPNMQLELWGGHKMNFITNSWSWPCSRPPAPLPTAAFCLGDRASSHPCKAQFCRDWDNSLFFTMSITLDLPRCPLPWRQAPEGGSCYCHTKAFLLHKIAVNHYGKEFVEFLMHYYPQEATILRFQSSGKTKSQTRNSAIFPFFFFHIFCQFPLAAALTTQEQLVSQVGFSWKMALPGVLSKE